MSTACILLACYLLVPPPELLRRRCPQLLDSPNQSRSQHSRRLQLPRLLRRLWQFLRRRISTGAQIAPAVLLDAAASLDVVSHCLQSGMALSPALRAGARMCPPELAEALIRCAARIEVGAAAAWASVSDHPAWAPLATAARRSHDTGAALAEQLEELAETFRSQAEDAAHATAERAAVAIAGPLALCFLPAFVVLGLIPTVAGLAGTMFGDLGFAGQS